jgi:hypothetical protein
MSFTPPHDPDHAPDPASTLSPGIRIMIKSMSMRIGEKNERKERRRSLTTYELSI